MAKTAGEPFVLVKLQTTLDAETVPHPKGKAPKLTGNGKAKTSTAGTLLAGTEFCTVAVKLTVAPTSTGPETACPRATERSALPDPETMFSPTETL
jgi:hypothetical protein